MSRFDKVFDKISTGYDLKIKSANKKYANTIQFLGETCNRIVNILDLKPIHGKLICERIDHGTGLQYEYSTMYMMIFGHKYLVVLDFSMPCSLNEIFIKQYHYVKPETVDYPNIGYIEKNNEPYYGGISLDFHQKDFEETLINVVSKYLVIDCDKEKFLLAEIPNVKFDTNG